MLEEMQGHANLFKRRLKYLLVTLSFYSIKLIRFVVILDDKFSCLLLLFDVRVYSGKPITSSYLVLRSFEPYKILVSICGDFEDQQRTYFLCTPKIKTKVSQRKYRLDES